MLIEPVFTNFIAYDNLDLDNVAIEVYCRKLLIDKPSSRGNNQAFIKDLNVDNTDIAIMPLMDAVLERFNFLHQNYNFSGAMCQRIEDAWINIGNCNNTLMLHSHRNRFFSAVYYVKGTPDSGNITFVSPITAQPYVIDNSVIDKFNSFNMNNRWFDPVPGRLIIFPSWLEHFVSPNFTDQDRISIAFNSTIVNKPDAGQV
jgi:hypothetical protein